MKKIYKIYCVDCKHNRRYLRGVGVVQYTTCYHPHSKYFEDTPFRRETMYKEWWGRNTNNDCKDFEQYKKPESFIKKIFKSWSKKCIQLKRN